MADEPRRPLLNPVLRFTKDPRPEGITGGGKNARGIKEERLSGQRRTLSEQFASLAEQSEKVPRFGGHAIIYAAMFDDSLAPTWTPSDLFHRDRGARLIAPYGSGYLVEMEAKQLASYAGVVRRADSARDMVDISRVEAVRFFEPADATRARSLAEMWEAAPETDKGRAFVIWLMPLADSSAVDQLLETVATLRRQVIQPPPPLLEMLRDRLDTGVPAVMRRRIQAAGSADRLNLAMREYRQRGRCRTTVIVPSPRALTQLVASGAVFRIDPVRPLTSTSPGEGREPDRPLPSDLTALPVVGVVDGGLTATSYKSAEAWKAPALVNDAIADVKHGNRVTSLIVQGHDWNNNLTLPPLYCQVGTVQAVPKKGARTFVSTQDLILYLDAVMAANPDTKVWNFSLNESVSCELDCVSDLGHDIAVLARKHRVLPVISVGNKPGDRLQPPADCEAAITVGGRLHDEQGGPAGECPVSHCGPGPSSMLKPELSHFSHVRALGGVTITGSSFATALTSPVAAHTMARLREPSPDLVKALIMHNTDGNGFDPALGFGTPGALTLPWECRPGFVTLQWAASLRPGAAYYWELPIPPALRATGKLKGQGALTAILNPHPLVSEFAGPNYFSVRLGTALQYPWKGKFNNLLGSLDAEMVMTEQEARVLDHKWSPIRHHRRDFSSRGISFDGDTLRVYARIYTRDLYLYDYQNIDEAPEMETVFVLSLGTGDDDDDIYNQLRDELGAFVETATIETDIDIENDGG